MEHTSRSLRQEEIDGFWRFNFVQAITAYNKEHARPAKFIMQTKAYKYRLVEFGEARIGEWSFSISGKGDFFCYKLSDYLSAIEQVWDKALNVLDLEGEIEIGKHFSHPKANPDAEPDTEAINE